MGEWVKTGDRCLHQTRPDATWSIKDGVNPGSVWRCSCGHESKLSLGFNFIPYWAEVKEQRWPKENDIATAPANIDRLELFKSQADAGEFKDDSLGSVYRFTNGKWVKVGELE